MTHTIRQVRRALRGYYGTRGYRISKDGTVSVYVPHRDAGHSGIWAFHGWIGHPELERWVAATLAAIY